MNTGYREIETWKGFKPGSKTELRRILATVMVRKRKVDVAKDMPPKIVSRLFLEAGPALRKRLNARTEQFKAMSQAEKDALESGNHDEAAPTHVVMKLFQDNALDRADAVVDWLVDWLDQDGDDDKEKILVFGHHKKVLDKLEAGLTAKKQGAKTIRVDGSTSSNERDARIGRFKADPGCQVALLSIGACGTGLNLTEANCVLFAEMVWSPAAHAQAEDRIHRVTQDKTCNARAGAEISRLD